MFPAVATVYGLSVDAVVNSGLVATLALDQSLTQPECPAHPTPKSDLKPIQTIISKMETSDPVTQAVIDNVAGKLPLKKEPVRCEVCNLSLSGQSVYDTHITGVKHRKKLALQQQGTPATPQKTKTYNYASITSNALSGLRNAVPPPKTPPVFPCKLCGVVVNSAEQLAYHELGKAHKKKAGLDIPKTDATNTDGADPVKSAAPKPEDGPLPDCVTKKTEGTVTFYTCTLCNKSSNSVEQLNIHMGSRIHKSRTRGVFGNRSAPYDRKKQFAANTFRSFRSGGTLGQESSPAYPTTVSYPAYNARAMTDTSQYGFSEQPRAFWKTNGNASGVNSYSNMGYNYNTNNYAGKQYNGGYNKSGNSDENGSSYGNSAPYNGGYGNPSFGSATGRYGSQYGDGNVGRGGKKALFSGKIAGYNNYDKITPSKAKHYFNSATASQPVYQTQQVQYMEYLDM